MEVHFESKGDFNEITKWLKDVAQRTPTVALNQIASEGERSLSANTPKDTGATAAGWDSFIESSGTTSEIVWVNNAHPDANVNLAKLLDQGYINGTGGYVPPRPYIKKAMESVWNTAGEKVAEELVK